MTDLERSVSVQLRERALQEVETRGLSDFDLAKLLDLFPDGARRLKNQSEWPVGTALAVLEKMGFMVEVEVKTH